MDNNYKQKFRSLAQYSLLGIFIQCFVLTTAFGQTQIAVSGTVTAAGEGTGLPGVNVVVKNTNTGTTTDADGKFTIQVPDDATLIFSFIGYTTQEIAVAGRTVVDVTMSSDVKQLSEVVVVGYGTQQRVTLTGAVSDIKGSEMRQTKNENPQNMLTGRIAGVRMWQRSSEPGTYANNFDIRGFESLSGGPLVVIDGVPRSMEDFQRLNPADIDNVSVLKDASAAIYGVRAAGGVVLVTTKKGTKGAVQVNYNGSYTVQRPSGFPKLADPYETMTLYNEKSKNIDNFSTPYPESKFEEYRSGALRTSDWNKLVFADYVPQTQHDLSLSGGTDKTQYYVGMGYLYQGGFFASGDLNYHKYNLRTNITSELTKGLTFNLNLAGMADERNTPYSDAVDIIRNYWRQGVLFPAYADPEETLLSYDGLDLEENTVAKARADVSGYRKYQQKQIQSSASLTYDFGTVTEVLKGLTAKGLFSLDYRQDNNSIFKKEYNQYRYNTTTGEYDPKLYAPSFINQMRRENYNRTQWLGQFLLNYTRTFARDHNVNAVFGLESQQRTGDNFYAQRNLAFAQDLLSAGVSTNQISGMSTDYANLYKYSNRAIIGRLNYTFADRYIIEGQFRRDASSKFSENSKYAFFPSGSIGWRVSEESFFKSISALSFVSQLKLRASYGELGDDGQLQYDWATGYIYPATSGNEEKGYYNQYAPGYMFGGEFIYGVNPIAIPNPYITWSTSKTLDIGVDFEAWNGLFGFSLDYFDRRREGLFARRTSGLPTVVGALPPNENLNSDQQFGLDLEINHRHQIGNVRYKLKAISTITRRKWLVAVNNGPYGNSYDQWRNDNFTNRYQGIQFGYEGAGRYENWEDIWSYPIYKDRDVLPGDYKYVDWNGDGEINGQDEHPFAFDQTPWLNFSMGADVQYKAFDLNFLLQGTAMGSMQYQEPLYRIWGTNGGGTLTQYLDRWRPADPNAPLYNPSTEWISGYYSYMGTGGPRANSDFNRVSTAYLRLKSVEIGYTIPNTIRGFEKTNIRVFANAYNLVTITKVKFVDPEHPDSDLGRLYPLNKTYTIGISARL